jgi:hypothetical protein
VAPLSSFSEHDRVLFLSPPEDGYLQAVAARLTVGLVVVLGSDEQVSHGRRQHSGLDNVMFVAASPDDIPWQDGFFSRVLDPAGLCVDSPKVAMEMARVLASNDR